MKEYTKPMLSVYSLKSEERFAEICEWQEDPDFPFWVAPNDEPKGKYCEFHNQWVRNAS